MNLRKRPYLSSFTSGYHVLIQVILITMTLGTLKTFAQKPSDVDNIKLLIENYAQARKESDPEKIKSLFTTDADQLVSSGVWRKGMDTLVEGMLQSSQSNPGDRTLSVESVRFTGKKNAIADARYEIKGRSGVTERNMWSTFLLVKQGQHWKITAIRNMLPAIP